MSRRKKAIHRKYLPDPKYNDILVTRFINVLMKDGKKSTAERVFYGALDIVGEKNEGTSPLEMFRKAMENVKPNIEVKSRRVGGATYQVPIEVRQDRKIALAIRWMIASSLKRNENYMKNKLAGEIIDAVNNSGASVKKRDDTHKMAEANRAFAHFRW